MITSIATLNAASVLKYVYAPGLPVHKLPLYSGNILELHNDRAHQWFDFSFRINHEYDKELLNQVISQQFIPAFVRQGYQELLDELCNSFKHGIENIWFEYDHPFPDTPSLFFDIHKQNRTTNAEKFFDIQKVCELFQVRCNPGLLDFLKLLDSNHLEVLYVGLMLPRPSSPIRLTIKSINADRLVDTITRLGWRGDTKLLSNIKRDYISNGQHLLLDVDYDSSIGTKIGIEIFDEQPLELINTFRRHGIYEGAYYEFLNSWAGMERLPSGIANDLSLIYKRNISFLHKRINHFKFTLEDELVKTKAYLYYCF